MLIIFSLTTKAQEWEDPVSTSDWNKLWKSAFVQSAEASNAPGPTGWYWGINMNHHANDSSYRFNGQIAIQNNHLNPNMYFRSTNASGSGVWAKVISSKGLQVIEGDMLVNKVKVTQQLPDTGRFVAQSWVNNRNPLFNLRLESSWDHSTGINYRFIQEYNANNYDVLSFQAGRVGIGAINHSSHKLIVEGSVGAREIQVEASGWSDFVFSPDYRLPSLEEVETFIIRNKHLPEVPSEEEVLKDGIKLGEMDAKLLQKIEELTLYTIELNKMMKQMKKENTELKERVQILEEK